MKDVDGFKITLSYGADYLIGTGFMIPAIWSVSSEQEEELTGGGLPIPTPVEGYVLLDTGAGHVGIDTTVVQQLNLNLLQGTRDIHGIDYAETINRYIARLTLPVTPLVKGNVISSQVMGLRLPIEAWELNNIRTAHADYKTLEGTPLDVIGVLGRTFLQYTKFVYDGLTGKMDMYIDKAAMDNARSKNITE